MISKTSFYNSRIKRIIMSYSNTRETYLNFCTSTWNHIFMPLMHCHSV